MEKTSEYVFEFGDFCLREAKDDDAAGLLAITNDVKTMEYYGEEGSYYPDLEAALGEIRCW